MALYDFGSTSKSLPSTGKSEFEILKESHRFLRDEGEGQENLSWDEQLAAKYYSSLYREFAVCNLKHYKSGNFALRWRTESEVLSGAGETTCGNTRCQHHSLSNGSHAPRLSTLELPFSYVEREEGKFALVKVVLCPRCLDKLLWKRRKDKESRESVDPEPSRRSTPNPQAVTSGDLLHQSHQRRSGDLPMEDAREKHRTRDSRFKNRFQAGRDEPRKQSSRSRSPRPNQDHRGRDPYRRRS